MGRGRATVAATVMMVVTLAACGGGAESSGRASSQSSAERDASQAATDLDLLRDMWRDLSTSWESGTANGLKVAWSHAYPGLPSISEAGCEKATFPGGRVEGYREELVPDLTSVELDQAWRYPPAPSFRLRGRIYKMSVSATITSPQLTKPAERSAEVHVAIKDGRAYSFPKCD